MLTFDPISGVYISYVANCLPHAGEALRNVVRIHHVYDHTPRRDIHLTLLEQIKHPTSVDSGDIDVKIARAEERDFWQKTGENARRRVD